MDPRPLVREQIDAGAKFLAELDKTVPVAAAFWLRRQDQQYWRLYLASHRYEDGDRIAVQGEVTRVILAMRDPDLDLMQVHLIKPSDPLVRAALDYQRPYLGKAMRLYDQLFGNIVVDEVYIYPAPLAVS